MSQAVAKWNGLRLRISAFDTILTVG